MNEEISDVLIVKCKKKGIFIPYSGKRNSFSYAVRHNSFLYPILNEVVDKLLTTGIAQHLYKNYVKTILFEEEKKQLKVLTLSDLSFGFTLWGVACGISALAFLIEFSWVRFKKIARQIIGLIFFVTLLKMRLKIVY